MHPAPYRTRRPAALYLLHGVWVASCPDCGHELGRSRDEAQAEHAGRWRRCPICQPAGEAVISCPRDDLGRRPRAPGAGDQQRDAMGARGSEALVWIGATCISGSATALRALADACEQAAAMAEEYDSDPDAFTQREQADRDLDR